LALAIGSSAFGRQAKANANAKVFSRLFVMKDSQFKGMFEQDEDLRRNELIRKIEHSVENLTLPELEALYYDMLTKDYIR
jgi:hypothetical protein